MRKIMKRLCVLLILVAACWFAGTEKSQVLAAGNGAFITKELQGTPEKAPKAEQEGYIFAGYYEEEDCETPVKAATNGTVWAKFVPSETLSVKAQLRAGTKNNSASTNLRLVSSVDSLNYSSVGFEVYYNGAKNPVIVKTSTVYERIVASAQSGVDYNYSPKVVGTESEYFVTATLVNINQSNFDKGFYIKPYWKTLDGTTVYGEGKYLTVNNGIDTNNINVAVKTDKALNAGSLSVTVGGTSCPATVAYYDGACAYVNVTVNNRDSALKSLSKVVVSDGTTSATTEYRNLMTKYTGIADTSWYDNSSDTKKYIVATSADLYGIAKIANEGGANGTKDNFAEKEIYIVADIAVNSETLITESIDANYTKWRSYNKASGEYTYAAAPTYSWTPISEFAGKFYGEGHTISGLYTKYGNVQNVGMFAKTTAISCIENFKLVNSYFENSQKDLVASIGSIAGAGKGTFYTIYSDALVFTQGQRVGGLIGDASSSTSDSTIKFNMTNCWFDGRVTSDRKGDVRVGGLIGTLSTGNYNTIMNCLNTGHVHVSNTEAELKYIGGVVGHVASTNTKATIKNLLNIGDVTKDYSSATYMDSLIGRKNSAETENLYSTSETSVGTKVAVEAIKGKNAEDSDLKELFTDGVWTTVNAHIPVLASLKTAVIDDTWYDEDEDTFVLYDKADLYGLATLSQTNDFEGKTIKLGADIEVIAGDADTWGATPAKSMWITIGNSNMPFAGMFDGGLHTIQGIYLETDQRGGLFAGTTSTAIVKNLYLKNSFFKSTVTSGMANIGTIAGVAKGTFNTIYSNANVTGWGQGIGGLVGQVAGDFTMMNCWFGGNATSIRESDARIGGLIGTVQGGNANKNLIYNCLNTGCVNASVATGEKVRVGGLVGHVGGNYAIQLTNSLNTGSVQYNEGTTLYDAIVGGPSSTTQISDSYATTDSCLQAGSNFGTSVTDAAIDKSTIIGSEAKNTLTSFDFTNIWQTVESGTPTLNFVQSTQSFDTSWYNVAATEYVLYEKDDLYGLAEMSKFTNFAEKIIRLGKDIVVNEGNANTWGTTAPENARVWEPIGSSSQKFAGKFYGDSHTISGIYLKTKNQNTGFFGYTDTPAEVKEFKITNSYFESTASVANLGSLAGVALGTFDTIYSNAIVVGTGQNVAGFLGQISNGATLRNCWFEGSVSNTKTSTIRLGGLVGFVTSATTESTVENCLNSGYINASKVSGAEARVGGLVGAAQSNAKISIKTSLNVGKVNSNKATGLYGSIIGGIGTNSVVTVTNSYATSESCGKTGVDQEAFGLSSIQGTNATTNLQGFDFDTTWTTVDGYTPLLTSFANLVIDTSWYYANPEAETFVLSDAQDLYGFASLSQKNKFENKTIKLGKDITVNTSDADDWDTTAPNRVWIPIGNSTYPFVGTFDGQGHTISGLYLSTSNAGGLFGYTGTSACVMNLSLLNSYFNSTSTGTMSNIGSVAGVGKGTFQRIYSKAIVVGNAQGVGGLLGQANTFTMTNCWFDGSVTGTKLDDHRMGGLVGTVTAGTYSTNKIYNCLNTAPVNASKANSTKVRVGGLVGFVASSYSLTLENSLNTGVVTFNTATDLYDGLIGAAVNTNMKVINSYATKESCSNFGTKISGGIAVNKEDILGTAAKSVLKNFDFYTIWEVRENDTPILIMEMVTLDEFIVSDVADLIAIATMSKTTNFAGKTIKLANNINLNNKQWTPIGTKDSATRFAGTFDGQGYIISNLRMEATADYAGLFAATAPEAVVKNLIIENAEVSSTAKIAGIVAGLGHGTFSDIKVENATLIGGGRLGGIIGLAQNSVTLSNCSFSGTVTCVGADKENRYVGGLLGYVTGGTLKISNCMNAGTIIGSPDCISDNPGIGGLVGCISGAKSVAINSCVNVGNIIAEATVAVLGVGPVIGRYAAPSGGFEMFAIEKCYTVLSKDLVGIDGIVEVTVDAVKSDAEAAMPLLDWTVQWESVDGNFPKVRFSKTGFVASENLEVDRTSLTNLTTVYSASQVLKQGDIHAHANTDGDPNNGAIDGKVDLATWKTQMTTLDMDFAASLDHQSTLHINHQDWDQDLFIYGSEIGVSVRDASLNNEIVSGVHQNVYFTKEDDFANVLKSSTFRDAFDYLESYSNGQYYNGGNFKCGALYTHNWKEFIQTVQNNNGFYVIAHPNLDPSYITVDNWETEMKPYLVDGMGIEVMYKGLGTGNVKQCYQLWKKALNAGYKVYATAGTDTHTDLQTSLPDSGLLEALTSFYAAKAEGENYLSEAYVRYLRTGNFTAGSVGIQMSVGNTEMGGTGSFEDAYLEIGIGALHKSVYDETHKYRVDVWVEDGIMYSQPFKATTEDGQMTYLRTKADPNCKYYRVEIVDVTKNLRIALGNPIWNIEKYPNAQ